MKTEERFRQILNAGTRIGGASLGAAVGASVGVFVGGPPGAVLGGAVGSAFSAAIQALGQDITKQLLSPREESRVGYVLSLAVSEIQERMQQDEQLRGDGFFDSDCAGRSDAEEVIEHILLKSRQETEEKKLLYIAHLFANIAFESAVDVHMAHQLIREAEQLTYRQLTLLKLVEVQDRYDLRDHDYKGSDEVQYAMLPLLKEIHDLSASEYIMVVPESGGRSRFLLSMLDVCPKEMKLGGLGELMSSLMRLEDIPDEDISALAEALQ